MKRWNFTIIFSLLGAFLSWFGYLLLTRMDLSGVVFLLPTFPIIKFLNWDSILGFYHSGSPIDHFGMIKVMLIEITELGLLGWFIDLARHHRKIKP